MLQRFLQNHVLANLAFLMVIVVGIVSYMSLPRQQDPTVNFNWIQVLAFMPGASAEDVEQRITDPLEEAIANVQDIRFVNSSSREGIASILIRFNDINDRVFDKRVADLRREIQNKEDELPDDVDQPQVLEITTSNGFPTAMVVVSGPANDENLRIQARNVEKDLEFIKGIDSVSSSGLYEPELQVRFIPERLQSLGIEPSDISDTIRANFRDISAGSVDIGSQRWLIRLQGTTSAPEELAQLPIVTNEGEITLGSIATIERAREKASVMVSYQGRAAVLFSITKTAESNTLKLVDRIKAYTEERDQYSEETGVNVVLVDDQTSTTRSALQVMQTNALLGLLMVLIVTWLFLGWKISFFTSIAIPFILCGTFWVLISTGNTLNVVVLLGIVISLGMLVDDAVVVVEAIYYRLQRGADAVTASIEALKEVFAPVTTSVLTTIAAFLPLMLLPGILGKFMFVTPFVVTVALAISLIEAYWMLPAHIIAGNVNFKNPSKTQIKRTKYLHLLRLKYTRILTKAMRRPMLILSIAFALLLTSVAAIGLGVIKSNFFAADPLRIFYVNIEMPAGTTLQDTLKKSEEIEQRVRASLQAGESRSVVSYSGIMFTETEPFFGDNFGQVIISLNPHNNGMRSVYDIIESARATVQDVVGAQNISFLRLDGGPPVTAPITIKVIGNTFEDIRAGSQALSEIMANTHGVKDIKIDDSPGQRQLSLQLDHSALADTGLDPLTVSRALSLYIDGEIAASFQHDGEELNVRVKAQADKLVSIEQILRQPIALPNGDSIPLGELVIADRTTGMNRIRHFNFRRSIEVSADINKAETDTVKANKAILAAWDEIAAQHPNVSLDSSGILDDINESFSAMLKLFVFGLLLIYMILGTQFKSYTQPLLILTTVPLAFTGVALGLLINGNALSLYTMYGVIALAGIAVNAAIVMISTANTKLTNGMSTLHSAIYAARRRVVPIIITSLTTIAGLFSLAAGLGGYSLLWGPMATSIVWGLSFSATLTLLIIPIIFRFHADFMPKLGAYWQAASAVKRVLIALLLALFGLIYVLILEFFVLSDKRAKAKQPVARRNYLLLALQGLLALVYGLAYLAIHYGFIAFLVSAFVT